METIRTRQMEEEIARLRRALIAIKLGGVDVVATATAALEG